MSSAGGRLSRSSPKRIGSVDPYALKIPAPKGRNTHYRWNATSPLHAEPEDGAVLSSGGASKDNFDSARYWRQSPRFVRLRLSAPSRAAMMSSEDFGSRQAIPPIDARAYSILVETRSNPSSAGISSEFTSRRSKSRVSASTRNEPRNATTSSCGGVRI